MCANKNIYDLRIYDVRFARKDKTWKTNKTCCAQHAHKERFLKNMSLCEDKSNRANKANKPNGTNRANRTNKSNKEQVDSR